MTSCSNKISFCVIRNNHWWCCESWLLYLPCKFFNSCLKILQFSILVNIFIIFLWWWWWIWDLVLSMGFFAILVSLILMLIDVSLIWYRTLVCNRVWDFYFNTCFMDAMIIRFSPSMEKNSMVNENTSFLFLTKFKLFLLWWLRTWLFFSTGLLNCTRSLIFIIMDLS